MMTVKKLKEKLNEFADNTQVGFYDFEEGFFWKIDEVKLRRVCKDEDKFKISERKGDRIIVGIK